MEARDEPGDEASGEEDHWWEGPVGDSNGLDGEALPVTIKEELPGTMVRSMASGC